jgi:drug/metabolite transporter (DMT)-like permease
MKNQVKKGIVLAILAAALYAISSPLSKLLLDYMPPTVMAGFLYIGAGLGMGIIARCMPFLTWFFIICFALACFR